MWAFGFCTNLKEVIIPQNVEFINPFAFGYLEDEYFLKVPNFKIYCYAGTAGEQYAIDDEFDYELIHEHTYKDTVVKPTTTSQGYTLHICSVCGNSYKDNYTAKLTSGTNSSNQKVMNSKYTCTDKSVSVSWNAVEGADGYYLYRYSDFAPRWLKIADVTNATKYTSTNIPSGKTYSFKVRPYKLVNGKRTFMDDSNEVETATKPTKSVVLSIKGGSGSLSLVWNVISSDGYEIYVKNGNNWELATTVTNYKTNTYTLTGLSAGKQSIKIRAYKTDKNGKKVYNDYSDVRTATVK
jgi:hypothetical protein